MLKYSTLSEFYAQKKYGEKQTETQQPAQSVFNGSLAVAACKSESSKIKLCRRPHSRTWWESHWNK